MDLKTAEKMLRKVTNEKNHKYKAWQRALNGYKEAEKRWSDAVGVMLTARHAAINLATLNKYRATLKKK